jgi:hypothetical protein
VGWLHGPQAYGKSASLEKIKTPTNKNGHRTSGSNLARMVAATSSGIDGTHGLQYIQTPSNEEDVYVKISHLRGGWAFFG